MSENTRSRRASSKRSASNRSSRARSVASLDDGDLELSNRDWLQDLERRSGRNVNPNDVDNTNPTDQGDVDRPVATENLDNPAGFVFLSFVEVRVQGY